MIDLDVPYLVIIETDKYAGNFCREMVAYCTGEYGECGCGVSESNDYFDHFDNEMFIDVVAHLPDEHGCYRPSSTYEFNNKNNAVAIPFSEKPTKDMLERIHTRANTYAKTTENCLGVKRDITILCCEVRTCQNDN